MGKSVSPVLKNSLLKVKAVGRNNYFVQKIAAEVSTTTIGRMVRQKRINYSGIAQNITNGVKLFINVINGLARNVLSNRNTPLLTTLKTLEFMFLLDSILTMALLFVERAIKELTRVLVEKPASVLNQITWKVKAA